MFHAQPTAKGNYIYYQGETKSHQFLENFFVWRGLGRKWSRMHSGRQDVSRLEALIQFNSIQFNWVFEKKKKKIQFNSASYLLRVEHDKFTENLFSHGPQKKEKRKRDNKVSERRKKKGGGDTKGNITSWNRESQKTTGRASDSGFGVSRPHGLVVRRWADISGRTQRRFDSIPLTDQSHEPLSL